MSTEHGSESTTASAPRPQTSRLGFGSARLDEYFGVWAIKREHAEGLVEQVGRMNLRVHVLAQEAAAEVDAQATPSAASRFGDARDEILLDDGTAVIRIEGTLMKFTGSLSRGTGTVRLRQIVRRAKADPTVARVMLVIDSPGGTVAGTKELADDIADLAATKTTHVYVEDLMASAALWIGVQGSVVSAGDTALIGSIGTLMVVHDYSKLANKKGIKVHVISTGDFKGAGAPGSKITNEQLAEWQRLVDGLNAKFLDAIARGRKKLPRSKVEELADGRVHLAADALASGLIDHVESFDAAMARLRQTPAKRTSGASAEAHTPTAGEETINNTAATEAPSQATVIQPGAEQENTSMSKETQTPASASTQAAAEAKPASMAELKAACPGAPSDFLVEQAEKGATVAQAQEAFLGFQAAQIRARDEEIAQLKAASKPTEEPKAEAKTEANEPKKAPGVKAIESKAAEAKADAGDAVAEFENRVKALVEKGLPRAKASAQVFAADEQLRADYLAAKNSR